MNETDQQFSVMAIVALTTAVAIGLALLRVGLDGSMAFFLVGVVVLLAVGGGVVGFVRHGRGGIVGGAVIGMFLGMLSWPILGTAIVILAEVIQAT